MVQAIINICGIGIRCRSSEKIFKMQFPQGYDTMVGKNAVLMSGGQAQRLQIARALAWEGRILIVEVVEKNEQNSYLTIT